MELSIESVKSPILITGAGGGLGTTLVELLLRAGYTRVICHHRERSEALKGILDKHGVDPESSLVAAELTDEHQVADMHRRIHQRHGPLYGLINLAGGSSNGVSWKLSTADFRRVIDTNLLTTFLCCREFVPEMREQGYGRIVNISSVVGLTGVPGAAHYCAAKAAVLGFTKALALELAPRNVIVSAVALGYFEHGLIHSIPAEHQERIRASIPARRFGNGCELAGLLTYLLGDSGGYSGGQVYHLNGGLHT
jgi:NAD(P)-dependent dehydrogenase (short-subunit alcohol dehydrogenase family)